MYRRLMPVVVAAVVAATACGDDGSNTDTADEVESANEAAADDEAAADTAADDDAATDNDSDVSSEDEADEPADGDESADSGVSPVVAGEGFPEDRCAANEAAGEIAYYSGFNYAAAASLTEVFVADAKGYYDELCLDVTITPSFSTANTPLVAAGEVQFSSAGSFTELAQYADREEADLVALSIASHVAIDVLMVKPDQAGSLAELAGTTIGVKGALPPAIAVLLAQEADLTEGVDYETALLEGFDPTAHWAIEEMTALPGWRSNEPAALGRAGIEFDLYDPADFDVPGSFGIIYTSREFLEAHPTAAEDFMRATMRGLADAVADPEGTAQIVFDLAEANGNPGFQTLEGELFRWTVDAATIANNTSDGIGLGVPQIDALESAMAAYDAVGYFGEEGVPPVGPAVDADLVAGLYDGDTLIWPAG